MLEGMGLGLETPYVPTKFKEDCVKQARWSGALCWALMAVAVTSQSFWVFARGNQNASRNGDGRAISYEILPDDMNTVIVIGVKADVNEPQLRATLAKAADEHQDAARDYLTADFLSVQAYLVREERQSAAPAGQLRRYVPAGNARERKKTTGDRGKEDSFTITLDDAKRTLQ